jgi:hypothetical protein
MFRKEHHAVIYTYPSHFSQGDSVVLTRKVAVLVILISTAPLVSLVSAQPARTAPLAPSESIPNLGPLLERVNALKSEVREYYACTCKCGCYAKDVDHEADLAVAFLRKRDQVSSANFEYNGRDFNAWIASAQAPAIPGTLRVYNEAQQLGVSVFFLTGRADSQRASTETNLRLRGFSRWEQLIMRTPAQKGTTALAYKSAARAKLVAAHYSIVLNVGDQWSDLRGKPEAEYSVKYPDPFYFIQ